MEFNSGFKGLNSFRKLGFQ